MKRGDKVVCVDHLPEATGLQGWTIYTVKNYWINPRDSGWQIDLDLGDVAAVELEEVGGLFKATRFKPTTPLDA